MRRIGWPRARLLPGGGDAEIGPTAAGGVDPLYPGVAEVLGDQMHGVGGAAAGHADVGGRGAGVLVEDQVAGVSSLALHAVEGAG